MMQVTETLSEGLKRELKVVIPAKELDASLSRRLDEMKDRVQIKGFRQGKVPVSHLRRVYGRNVMAEIIQEQLNESSRKAIEQRDEKPAFQPRIELSEDEKEIEQVMEGKADLAFSLAFEIMPAIDLADLSKISVTREVAEVPQEDIDAAIERIADQNRPFTARDAGEKARDGDRVTIDYEGFVDGEAFQGGKDEGAFLVLGSGQFIPGFEDQLKGAKAGDEPTVKVTFPEGYPAEHLAGKDAEFKVKVREVAAPGDLVIDDEFAKQLGMESLGKLRDAVREQMSGELLAQSRNKLKRAILDELDKAHAFELPPTLVEQEFDSIWQQMTREMEEAKRSFEDEGSSEEDARAEYRKMAERRVRLGLVLSEYGERNEVKVSEDEVNRSLIEQARRFPGQEKAVWDYYHKNPQAMAQLRAPLFEDKVIDYVLELAKVKEITVSRDELFHDHTHDGEHAHDHGHDHDHGDEKPAKKKPAAKKKAEPKKAAAKKDETKAGE